jgi:hypothetical protein
MTKYFLGLDLGKQADHTALSIVEKMRPPREGEPTYSVIAGRRVDTRPIAPPFYNCLNLHRYPLGTSYPAIVQKVKDVVEAEELKGQYSLVIDATGVGTPLVDMFREVGLRPVPVVITGGQTVNHDKGIYTVPKRILVSTLKREVSSGRLNVAPGPFREVLQKEMGTFDLTVTEAANDTYEGRKGAHDDIVLSVALAVWQAANEQPRAVRPRSVNARY